MVAMLANMHYQDFKNDFLLRNLLRKMALHISFSCSKLIFFLRLNLCMNDNCQYKKYKNISKLPPRGVVSKYKCSNLSIYLVIMDRDW